MDGIIDIIIAVLFIAVPAIFKAIGNNLEKSGKPEKAEKYKKIAEAMTDDDKSVFDEPVPDSALEESGQEMYGFDSVDESWEEDIYNEPVPEIQMIPMVPEPAVENVVSQIKTTARPDRIKPANRKPILLEEEQEKKEVEKIDPKKLVIYSEIMKPKF